MTVYLANRHHLSRTDPIINSNGRWLRLCDGGLSDRGAWIKVANFFGIPSVEVPVDRQEILAAILEPGYGAQNGSILEVAVPVIAQWVGQKIHDAKRGQQYPHPSWCKERLTMEDIERPRLSINPEEFFSD